MITEVKQLFSSVWNSFWHFLDPITFFVPVVEKIVIMYWLLAGTISAIVYGMTGVRPRLWFGQYFDGPVTPGAPLEWTAMIFWTAIAVTVLISGYFTSRSGGTQKKAVGTALFWGAFVALMALLFARW
jgi:hypothetical protein